MKYFEYKVKNDKVCGTCVISARDTVHAMQKAFCMHGGQGTFDKSKSTGIDYTSFREITTKERLRYE